MVWRVCGRIGWQISDVKWNLIIIINNVRSTHKAWIGIAAQQMLYLISLVFAQSSVLTLAGMRRVMRKMRDYVTTDDISYFSFGIFVFGNHSVCRRCVTMSPLHTLPLSDIVIMLSSIHVPNTAKNYTIPWMSYLCTRIYTLFIVVWRRCHATNSYVVRIPHTYPISLLSNVEYVRCARWEASNCAGFRFYAKEFRVCSVEKFSNESVDFIIYYLADKMENINRRIK